MATDYNSRAARGQALNLAVMEAISLGTSDDTPYILSRFLHFLNLSEVVQSIDLEVLKQELQLETKNANE